MEFKNLYLNNKDGTSKRSFGQYPILGDIIRMLEEGIDKRKVDYIVLCLGDTLGVSNKLCKTSQKIRHTL